MILRRSQRAEATNAALRDECVGLRAALDASLRLSDEKVNQEIRQRAELQVMAIT